MLSAARSLRCRPRLLLAAGCAALLLGAMAAKSAQADHAVLSFPAVAGTEWKVAGGYNTPTHIAEDPHALDLVRVDGETAGTPVVAPLNGRVTSTTSASGCVTVRDNHGILVLICHIIPDSGLRSGANVVRGQTIGTVAPAGQAANNGLAHIHLALHRNFDRGQVQTIPFAGSYALEGRELPHTDAANAYSGLTFVAGSQPVPATPSVNPFGPAPAATAQPRPSSTQPASPPNTTSSLPGVASVTPTGAYVKGANGIVVIGGGAPAAVATKIGADSGRGVEALWMLSAGRWLYFLPAAPGVNGGLSSLPATPVSVLVVLS